MNNSSTVPERILTMLGGVFNWVEEMMRDDEHC